MKYAVTAWVELDGKLHKPPEVLALDEAVAQPLVDLGVLELVPAEVAVPSVKAKPKTDTEGKV